VIDCRQVLGSEDGVAHRVEDLAEMPRASSLLDAAPARPELRWPASALCLGEPWRMLS
jgi:hypothetical protein